MLNPRRWFHRIVIAVAVALFMLLTSTRSEVDSGSSPLCRERASRYDGRFTMVRLWYPHYAGWSYDYPDMEQNLTLILKRSHVHACHGPTAATSCGWTIRSC